MKLPQPFGPIWNLRLVRRVSLSFFVAVFGMVVGCSVMGRFECAAAFAISAVIFGFYWRFAREFSLGMEKWSQRPGYRLRPPHAGLR